MRTFIFLSMLLSVAGIATAQDTMRIIVDKDFMANLSDAMKIQSNPNPEVPVVEKDTFVYFTPEIMRKDVPLAYPIKPLSLGTQLLPKLKNNYIRLGYGNYSSPLAELYLNTTRNRNYQAGLYLKHFSAHPSDNRTFSDNTASVFGKKFLKGGILEGDFLYHNPAAKLYSLPLNIVLPQPASDLNASNSFNLSQFRVSFSNVGKDTSKLAYRISPTFYHYGSSFGLSETDFALKGDFRKFITGNPLDVFANVEMTNLNGNKVDYDRLFVDLNPTYRLLISRAYIQLGFNSTYFKDSAGSKMHFYPRGEFGYQLIPKSLTAFVGFTGGLQRHSLRSLTTENPFLRTFVLNNTSTSFDLYLGLKGLLSAQTSFLLELSFASARNLLFYAGDSASYGQRAVYDGSSAGLTRINAELNHEFSEQFRLGFVMHYTGYDLAIAAPYSRPTLTTSFNLLYNMGNKFNLRGEIYTLNKRTGAYYGPVLTSYTPVSLKGLADLNLGIDYRYSKTVMVFLNVNNLTNNQYQRWVDKQVLGINVLGGLGITF